MSSTCCKRLDKTYWAVDYQNWVTQDDPCLKVTPVWSCKHCLTCRHHCLPTIILWSPSLFWMTVSLLNMIGCNWVSTRVPNSRKLAPLVKLTVFQALHLRVETSVIQSTGMASLCPTNCIQALAFFRKNLLIGNSEKYVHNLSMLSWATILSIWSVPTPSLWIGRHHVSFAGVFVGPSSGHFKICCCSHQKSSYRYGLIARRPQSETLSYGRVYWNCNILIQHLGHFWHKWRLSTNLLPLPSSARIFWAALQTAILICNILQRFWGILYAFLLRRKSRWIACSFCR